MSIDCRVFHFPVGDGDRFPYYDVPGYVAVETRRLADATKIVRYLKLGAADHPLSPLATREALLKSPLGEIARIKEDKAEEILRFMYDQETN